MTGATASALPGTHRVASAHLQCVSRAHDLGVQVLRRHPAKSDAPAGTSLRDRMVGRRDTRARSCERHRRLAETGMGVILPNEDASEAFIVNSSGEQRRRLGRCTLAAPGVVRATIPFPPEVTFHKVEQLVGLHVRILRWFLPRNATIEVNSKGLTSVAILSGTSCLWCQRQEGSNDESGAA